MGPVSTPLQALFGRALSRRQWMLGAAGAALGAGCALEPDADHAGPDAPEAGPLPGPLRTAWVFSSGGPRGFVHVGVIKALEELGCKPDLIVGSSVGAMVGALCAAGLPAAELQRLALELQPWQLVRWNPSGPERVSGSAIADLVRTQARVNLLQRLPTPMVCVAQRISDQAAIHFNRGDLGLAVQAACAIEGQFTPVRIRGERYADADLRLPLPVRLARGLGVRRVLAVDASAHEEQAPEGAQRYRAGDERKRALTRPDAQAADVLLHPEFGYYVSFSREFRERAIAAGYRATMAAAARVKALHQE